MTFNTQQAAAALLNGVPMPGTASEISLTEAAVSLGTYPVRADATAATTNGLFTELMNTRYRRRNGTGHPFHLQYRKRPE